MNKNIDLRKILEHCPRGTRLYSTTFGYVNFKMLIPSSEYPIIVYCKDEINEKSFTADGKFMKNYDAECTLFPSKDQRDWSKFSATWYKKEKFDPNTLKPFDKVLVFTNGEWTCDFFSHTLSGDIFNKRCMGFGDVNVVIPYNDETKHLVGTTEEAPDYYRYWEVECECKNQE